MTVDRSETRRRLLLVPHGRPCRLRKLEAERKREVTSSITCQSRTRDEKQQHPAAAAPAAALQHSARTPEEFDRIHSAIPRELIGAVERPGRSLISWRTRPPRICLERHGETLSTLPRWLTHQVRTYLVSGGRASLVGSVSALLHTARLFYFVFVFVFIFIFILFFGFPYSVTNFYALRVDAH